VSLWHTNTQEQKEPEATSPGGELSAGGDRGIGTTGGGVIKEKPRMEVGW